MFAIIKTGGKQYKVKASEILKIEKLENLNPENKIEFNEILAYGDDKNMEVGSPLVKGATTTFRIDDLDYMLYSQIPWVSSKYIVRQTLWQQNQTAFGRFFLQNTIFCDNVSPAEPAAATAPSEKLIMGQWRQ